MSILEVIISIIVVVIMAFIALLTFGMTQVAGKYDEVSERIYQKEMEKLERHKQLMKEVDENPEYIATEDRK
jgi:type II secretory pathway pseudopilin PulG